MINILHAVRKINPNAELSVNDNDVNQIEWLNGTTPIPVVDIEDKITELETAYDNNKYQRDRATEYPSIADQLDKIYHSGLTEWKKVIKATKDKYPKD